MISNIVHKSDFGLDVPFARLDSEFVEKDLLAVEKALQGLGGVLLADVQSKNIKFFEKSKISKKYEYISIYSVDNGDGLIFPVEYGNDDIPSRAKYLVNSGDIIVSNVRPNRGSVALLTDSHICHIASSGFTLLRPIGLSFSVEYVFCFLKSTYGRNQLIRRNRGSMYPAVAPGDVLDVFVPSPSNELDSVVRDKVKEAHKQHKEFYVLQNSLNEMLDDYLKKYGSPPSPIEPLVGAVESSVVNSSNFFANGGPIRFDAEFFRPGYDSFIHKLMSSEKTFLLGDYYELTTGRPLDKSDEVISSYAKQSILTNIGINWSALVEEQGCVPKGSIKIQDEDILLACTAHEIEYVGKKVDYVRSIPPCISKPIGCVADLMVIRPKENKPKKLYGSYVSAFLRSTQGKYQVQRCIRGLRGGHVYKDDLSRYVFVPIPSDTFLDKFEERAKECENLRNLSKKNIIEAIDLVENYFKGKIKL